MCFCVDKVTFFFFFFSSQLSSCFAELLIYYFIYLGCGKNTLYLAHRHLEINHCWWLDSDCKDFLLNTSEKPSCCEIPMTELWHIIETSLFNGLILNKERHIHICIFVITRHVFWCRYIYIWFKLVTIIIDCTKIKLYLNTRLILNIRCNRWLWFDKCCPHNTRSVFVGTSSR